MAGIDTTSPHYKGKYANIYEVNVDFPNGGSAGDYVDILGFAHYWNPDRNNWCVNEERDEYWDELLASAAEGVKRLETGLAEETSERANADAELSEDIEENSRKISAEMQARVAADAELNKTIEENSRKISEKIESVEKSVETLESELADERKERTEQDALLWGGIQNEADIRTAEDAKINKRIEEVEEDVAEIDIVVMTEDEVRDVLNDLL